MRSFLLITLTLLVTHRIFTPQDAVEEEDEDEEEEEEDSLQAVLPKTAHHRVANPSIPITIPPPLTSSPGTSTLASAPTSPARSGPGQVRVVKKFSNRADPLWSATAQT